jgi:nucleoside-diphosphate-sugar epimerase
VISGLKTEEALSGSWFFADVRDVAAAHVAAAQAPAAAGQRYIVSAGRSLSARQVTDAIKGRIRVDGTDGEVAEERRSIDSSKVLTRAWRTGSLVHTAMHVYCIAFAGHHIALGL